LNVPVTNNNRGDIFDTIVKIKAAGQTFWEAGSRHDFITKVGGWCNRIGMTKEFAMEMAEKVLPPIFANGDKYDCAIEMRKIYGSYPDQFNTWTWDEKNPPHDPLAINTLAEFEKYRVTKEKHIPDTPAMISIGNARVAAAGNITPITAEAKAGKTAATSVFIAGAISKTGVIDGFPDVSIVSNPQGKAVIHFDTEQSEADQQYNLKTVLKRAAINETPDYFLSYNIRTLALHQYQEFTKTVCSLANERFNGIHLIVVDGGADFISSVNDEAEANAIILFFNQLAVDYACPVILIVHLNENAGKNGDTMPRGHLGRQAVRKGYAQLNITKDGDVSVMQALRCRKAGSADTPLVCFKYNQEKGYQTPVDTVELKEEKEDRKKDIKFSKWKSMAEKAFPPTGSLSYVDAVNKLAKVSGTEYENGRKILKNLIAQEIVWRGDDENYRLGKAG
jgi:hypothetical protein